MSSDNGGIIGVVNDPTSTVASGVWQQEEQYEAKVNGTWPQRPLFTTKSLRFNNNSSDYLTFTPSSNGSRRIFTISFWFKTTTVAGGNSYMFSTGNYSGGDGFLQIKLSSSGRITVDDYDQSGGSYNLRWTTPSAGPLIRDPSAWYHFVLAVDSTQGTQSNRAKFYQNGVDISSSFTQTTSPAQNDDFHINTSSKIQQVGRSQNNDGYYDGYLAEFIVVDGQQLAPTSFGVSNSDGVWIPIIYEGTFGTNGFNLQFENAAALGEDSSANGNNFTVNNLTSIDQSTDYPEVNFATLNPLVGGLSGTFSEGNTRATIPPVNTSVVSNIAVNNGKWYCEVKFNTIVGYAVVGVSPMDQLSWTGNIAYYENSSPAFSEEGTLFTNGTQSGTSITISAGTVYGVMWDADNSILKITDGSDTFQRAYTVNDTSIPISFAFAVSSGSSTGDVSVNFGSPSFAISSGNTDGNGYGNFEYAVPSGYYALNTKNLAEFG